MNDWRKTLKTEEVKKAKKQVRQMMEGKSLLELKELFLELSRMRVCMMNRLNTDRANYRELTFLQMELKKKIEKLEIKKLKQSAERLKGEHHDT